MITVLTGQSATERLLYKGREISHEPDGGCAIGRGFPGGRGPPASCWRESPDSAARTRRRRTRRSNPNVQVSRLVSGKVSDYEVFTGRTQTMHYQDIKARVTGYLEKIYFKEGDDVQEGAPLFDIDSAPYDAARDQAQATANQADAQAKQALTHLQKCAGHLPTRRGFPQRHAGGDGHPGPRRRRRGPGRAQRRAGNAQGRPGRPQDRPDQRRLLPHQGGIRRTHQPTQRRSQQRRHRRQHRPGLARPAPAEDVRLLRRGRADHAGPRRQQAGQVPTRLPPAGQGFRGGGEEPAPRAQPGQRRQRPRDVRPPRKPGHRR